MVRSTLRRSGASAAPNCSFSLPFDEGQSFVRHHRRWQLVAIVTAFALAGCDSDDTGEPDAGAGGQEPVDCYECHGDEANGNSAPPPADWHETDVPDAHQRHLQGSDWHGWLECEDCHVVPTAVDDEGHIDDGLPAELTFSGLALSDSAAPTYDTATHTCTGGYCHGGTLMGGDALTTPDWFVLDGSQTECGVGCHENPPPLPHPESDLCRNCHNQVVDDSGGIKAPLLHIDGQVNVDDIDCNLCHGGGTDPHDPLNWAPPQDIAGNMDTSARGVGAHQAHLAPSSWRAEIVCGDCHVVPTSVMAAGHLGTALPAELTWSALATADGAAPTFDGTVCNNTYCHGSTLGPGGNNTTPEWTRVDGSQNACGTCHGVAPDNPPHAYVVNPSTCAPCHAYTGLDPNDPSTHINGVVDVVEPLPCNVCHGSSTNDAPPTDTTGQSSTAQRGVGAHQSHVQAGANTVAIPCDECHVVPTSWRDAGHRDTALPAEITFGTLAQARSHNPAWNGTSCDDAYCHVPRPDDLAPGTHYSPVWTTVDGSQSQCNSCHGYPPVYALHPASFLCGDPLCHSTVVGPDHMTITNKALHIDGAVNY